MGLKTLTLLNKSSKYLFQVLCRASFMKTYIQVCLTPGSPSVCNHHKMEKMVNSTPWRSPNGVPWHPSVPFSFVVLEGLFFLEDEEEAADFAMMLLVFFRCALQLVWLPVHMGCRAAFREASSVLGTADLSLVFPVKTLVLDYVRTSHYQEPSSTYQVLQYVLWSPCLGTTVHTEYLDMYKGGNTRGKPMNVHVSERAST